MNTVSVADRVIRDRVILGQGVEYTAKKNDISPEEVRRIMASNPRLVRLATKARRSIERRKYLDLAPYALKTLKSILKIDATEPILDKKGEIQGYKKNAMVLRVQREAAEGILETAGAKKSSKGGGINILNQNGAGKRTRKRGELEARPVKDILDACLITQAETHQITHSEESHGQEEG
jgi:hypothetical protein